MATTRAELRAHIRDILHDWPVTRGVLKTTMNASVAEVVLSTGDVPGDFKAGYCIQIEDEVMLIKSIDTVAAKLTVFRGHLASTAAAHDALKAITLYNLFPDFELNRHINRAIRTTWPRVWFARSVVHSSQTAANVLEYELANTNVFEVELEDGASSGIYFPIHAISLAQIMAAQGTPTPAETLHTWIRFHSQPATGRRIRYRYADRLAALSSDASEVWFESFEPGITEFLMWQAASYAAADLMGKRMQFHEYSVAVQDRVADVDAIIRTRFAYQNAAEVKMADMKRPLPPIWPQRRRR